LTLQKRSELLYLYLAFVTFRLIFNSTDVNFLIVVTMSENDGDKADDQVSKAETTAAAGESFEELCSFFEQDDEDDNQDEDPGDKTGNETFSNQSDQDVMDELDRLLAEEKESAAAAASIEKSSTEEESSTTKKKSSTEEESSTKENSSTEEKSSTKENSSTEEDSKTEQKLSTEEGKRRRRSNDEFNAAEDVKESDDGGEVENTRKIVNIGGLEIDLEASKRLAEEEGDDVTKKDDVTGTTAAGNIVIIGGMEIDLDQVLALGPEDEEYLNYDEDFDLQEAAGTLDNLDETKLFTLADDDDLVGADGGDEGEGEDKVKVGKTDADQAEQKKQEEEEEEEEDRPALGQGLSGPGPINSFSKRQIRIKYYRESKAEWIKTTKAGFPLPSVNQTSEVRAWKHPTIPNTYHGWEDVTEWADRCHPMWQEYRRVQPLEYHQFIHSKWGYSKQIDITRNLTKFSTSNSSASSKSSSSKNGGSSPMMSKAPCKYCDLVCFCSPGKRQKRPYWTSVVANDDTAPPSAKKAKLMAKEQFQEVVRGHLERQLNEKAAAAAQGQKAGSNTDAFLRRAVQVLRSVDETFDLAQRYALPSETPAFSDDQVKELLSLEETFDAFATHYKSPYDNDDDDSDDSDDEDAKDKKVEGSAAATDQAGSQQTKDPKIWNTSLLQDY